MNCQSPIRWAVTETSGARMPIDDDPVEDGNVIITSRQADGTPVVHVLAKGETVGTVPRYVAHFATCTNPPQRSKRGRRR